MDDRDLGSRVRGTVLLMRRVMTRQQALAAGHSAKELRVAVARGRWQRPFRGVLVTHAGPLTWRERMAAAVLAAGRGAVASGECALVLWGLSTREPSFLTVAVPVDRQVLTRLPGVRVRRRRRLTTARSQGIPVMGLHQTVLDVAALVTWDVDDVVGLLARACAPRRSTPAALRAELAHHPRHPRRQELDAVLEAAELGLESGAEWRYVTAVERPHGLPPMTPQAPLDGTHSAARRRVRRLDFLDEERGIGMEIDGELYHRGKFRDDRSRDRRNAGEGRITLRACWVDVVVTPCELAADVAVVQRARGWTGHPRACSPSCALARDPRLQGPPATAAGG
ncbi:hypothetical protein [Ornithinimicrobium cerasi]|uniref:hypothetical protein n=1 Tax=Ornithinimicrobium cerasi TaxID=2248773 RepID=UPI000F00BAD7|nr:hypothetical protein [Ornithinimicrobium cerasi]